MSQRYYNSRLRHTINTFKCDHFQKTSCPEGVYGLLTNRDIVSQPWDNITVDLKRPWEVKAKKQLVTFNSPTLIDTTTTLVKITHVDDKTCVHVTDKLRQC